MRLAVLSDVHSNLPALQAVLADVDRIAPDGIWVAGDLVGYNPWPNEVLEILRERHVRAIRGNHDRGAIGGDTSWFNELAAEGVRWTRIHLAPAPAVRSRCAGSDTTSMRSPRRSGKPACRTSSRIGCTAGCEPRRTRLCTVARSRDVRPGRFRCPFKNIYRPSSPRRS